MKCNLFCVFMLSIICWLEIMCGAAWMCVWAQGCVIFSVWVHVPPVPYCSAAELWSFQTLWQPSYLIGTVTIATQVCDLLSTAAHFSRAFLPPGYICTCYLGPQFIRHIRTSEHRVLHIIITDAILCQKTVSLQSETSAHIKPKLYVRYINKTRMEMRFYSIASNCKTHTYSSIPMCLCLCMKS